MASFLARTTTSTASSAAAATRLLLQELGISLLRRRRRFFASVLRSAFRTFEFGDAFIPATVTFSAAAASFASTLLFLA